jgi:hypothetical protein
VPIISASLSIQPDTPAQCNIQIPATDKALEFLPRTLIHVFFWDYHGGPGDTSLITVAEPDGVTTSDERAREQVRRMLEDQESSFEDDPALGVNLDRPQQTQQYSSSGTDPTLQAASGHSNAGRTDATQVRGEDSQQPEVDEDHMLADSRWKLFFTGEVIGFQFQKSSQSRAVILQCLDHSVYWDTCYQYKVNVASLHGNATAHFVGAGTSLFDTFFQSSTSTIVDVINRRSFSRPELTGLLSGVVHLLERVGGVYTNRGFRGVNDFFSIAELRLHLVDMITASEDDTSSQRVFPRRAFNRWTRRAGGSLGKIASFREILNLLNKFIFHNTVPNPVAMFVPPDVIERTNTRTVTTDLSTTPAGQEIARELRTIKSRAILDQASWTARDTRPAAVDPLPRAAYESVLRSQANIANTLGTLANRMRNLGARDAASAARLGRGKAQNIGRLLRRPHNGESASATITDDLRDLIEDIQAAIDSLGGATRRRTQRSTTTRNINARLNTQILRPDIFMCSPPKCNIIFPELYNSVSFTRQYLREVTRMRLQVSDEIFGPDVLLDNVYYAPDVEVLGERARQGGKNDGASLEGATLRRAAFTRRLMDHELLTGVVPVFERMNEVNIAAGRSNHIIYRGARVPFAARAANFQFFKHRLGPRTMSVSGKFNPWIAPGFPCVVIDRWMTNEMIEVSALRGLDLLAAASARGWWNVPQVRNETEVAAPDDFTPLDAWVALRETVPTQFVGLLMGVEHQVNQMSAATSYSMSTARTHREREELLGANRVRVARRDAGQVTRTTTVAALEGDPPRVGNLGPYYGQITRVDRLDRSGRYHLFGTFGADRPRQQRVRVEVGITQEARAFGPEVTALVQNPTQEVTFRAYRIQENVDRWVGQEVDVPMEDFLRPPWMSDVWANERIGAVYQQFFGTGAITDPITIDTGYTSAIDTTMQEEREAEADARRTDIQDPFRTEGRTIQEAEMAITVERAIDLLVRAYSAMKVSGMDVNEFIRAYTWRPVATLTDILGSRDLSIDPGTGRRTQGTEGFHSRAFGRGEMGSNLRNLVPENQAGQSTDPNEDVEGEEIGRGNNARRLLGIGTAQGRDRRNLLSRLDLRTRRGDAVFAYVSELWSSRGQLG